MAGAVGTLAAEVTRAAASAGLKRPARIGFAQVARPDDFALDLALQVAGFAATPLGTGDPPSALAGELGERGCRGLAHLAGDEDGTGLDVAEKARAAAEAGIPLLSLTSPGLAARRRAGEVRAVAAAGPGGDLDPGPMVVASGGEVRQVAQSDLFAAAERLAAGLAPRRGRDVVVDSLPLDEPAGRLLFAWSLLAGAALALEPEAGNLVASAVWVRPTVFAGTAPQRRSLRDWLVAHDRPRTPIGRRPRLPLRRLDTVLALDAMTVDERDFWTGRGAAVIAMNGPVV